MLTRIVPLAALLTLTACQQLDPYTRTDMWQPTGANAGNIAAMVADPNDLIRGRGSDRANTKPAVLAIERVATDKPKALRDPGGLSSTDAKGSGGGANGGAGAP